jgi:hypothetical protein
MAQRLFGGLIFMLAVFALAACQPEVVVVPTEISLDAISTERSATAAADALTVEALATPTRRPLPETWTPSPSPEPLPTADAPAAVNVFSEASATPLPPGGVIYYVYDGVTLAYARPDGSDQGVIPIPQNGSRIADLATAPDGAEVIYVGQSANNTREIFALDSSGMVTQLTRLAFPRIISPVYRGDSQMIAFFASPNREGPLDIYVMTRDGNGLRRVAGTSNAVRYSLTWGANDSDVLFYTDLQVFAIDTATNVQYEIAPNDARGEYYSVAHHPLVNELFFVRFEAEFGGSYSGPLIFRVLTDPLQNLPNQLVDSRPGDADEIRWNDTGSGMVILGDESVTLRLWPGGRLIDIAEGGRFAPQAAVSPDAEAVAFVYEGLEANNVPQVFLAQVVNPTEPRQLTHHPSGTISDLVWVAAN